MDWPSSRVSILSHPPPLTPRHRHTSVILFFWLIRRDKKRSSHLYSVNAQTTKKRGETTCSHSVCTHTSIPHSISPSPRVIYLSVRGRIDSPLYSRPLKPGGDSPCWAAGSNEKLKEHINSSIWGHEDENSCQRPARNNRSRNAALLYVSEVTGVKQQAKDARKGEHTESRPSLIGAPRRGFCVKTRLSVSSSKTSY